MHKPQKLRHQVDEYMDLWSQKVRKAKKAKRLSEELRAENF